MSVTGEKRLTYLALEAPRPGQASQVHVKEIVEGLRRREWDVRLLVPAYTLAQIKPGTLRKLFEYLRLQAKLWGGLKQGECIYVRGHPMAWPTGLLARLFGVPIVHEVNGPYEDIFVTYGWLGPLRRVIDSMQRAQFRWADAVLPVTQALKTWLEKEVGHDRVIVIPNGANTDLFTPWHPPSSEVKVDRFVAFFGGLAYWHGVDTMLEAAASPHWPEDVSLLVIGDGMERRKVQAAVAGNPRVIWLGAKPYESICGLVVRALCGLVVISDPDGRSQTGLLPLKLFETLACGVPVIVTDFPGQADLVRANECGLVIPSDDPTALALAVAQLAANPDNARQMGQRGAAVVRQEHSWDSRAADVDKLLGALRQSRTGRP